MRTSNMVGLVSRLVLIVVLTFVLLGAAGRAWAGDTVVLRAEGGPRVKARYVERAQKGLDMSTTAAGGVPATADLATLAGAADPAACAVDPACLARAGVAQGATRIVGVLLETTGGDQFRLTFVLVDVASAHELTRASFDMPKKELVDAPAIRIVEFMAAAPAAAAAPPKVADADPAPPDPALAPIATDVAAPPDTPPDASPGGPTTVAATMTGAAPHGKLHLGVHAGVVLPQLSSELDTTLGMELEAGYRVWRNLSPFFGAGYRQPVVDNGQDDARLVAGEYTATTTQRELTLTAGALWWFLRPGSSFNAYAGLGGRVYLLESITNGAAGGMPFLENRETSTRVGGVVLGGAELHVGPGAAVAGLEVGGSDLPHLVTGDVATTALQITLGYRMFL